MILGWINLAPHAVIPAPQRVVSFEMREAIFLLELRKHSMAAIVSR